MYDDSSRFLPYGHVAPLAPLHPHAAGGSLAPAVVAQLPHGVWGSPVPLHVPRADPIVPPSAPPAVQMPREPVSWVLVKHAALAAFALMAVLVAVAGHSAPMMLAPYAGTAMLCIVIFIAADRMRFLEHTGPIVVHDRWPDVAAPALVDAAPAAAPVMHNVLAGYAPRLAAASVSHAQQPMPAPPFHVSVT